MITICIEYGLTAWNKLIIIIIIIDIVPYLSLDGDSVRSLARQSFSDRLQLAIISADVCSCYSLSLLFHFGVHIIAPMTDVRAGKANNITLKWNWATKSALTIRSRPIMAARHDSQLSTCTTDGKLIVVIGESRRMSVRWNNAYSADFDIIIQQSQTVAFCRRFCFVSIWTIYFVTK